CIAMLLLSLLVLFGYGVYSSGPSADQPIPVNNNAYSDIHNGMTAGEVQWLLGKPSSDTGEMTIDGVPGSTRAQEYHQGGRTITVVFDSNGKVVYKEKKGF